MAAFSHKSLGFAPNSRNTKYYKSQKLVDPFKVEFHELNYALLPSFSHVYEPIMFRVDRFHQCKRLAKNKGVRDMFKGLELCPSVRKYFQRGITKEEIRGYVQGVCLGGISRWCVQSMSKGYIQGGIS